MLPFVMSAISNLGGAALNFASQENANMANVNLIRQQNEFNERLQREQWSRDDSQYQRTVADMRAAGLNPLAGVSPQSSPLSMQAQAPQVNPVDFSKDRIILISRSTSILFPVITLITNQFTI